MALSHWKLATGGGVKQRIGTQTKRLLFCFLLEGPKKYKNATNVDFFAKQQDSLKSNFRGGGGANGQILTFYAKKNGHFREI